MRHLTLRDQVHWAVRGHRGHCGDQEGEAGPADMTKEVIGEQAESEVKTSRAGLRGPKSWKRGNLVATKAAANKKRIEGLEVETRLAKVK